MRIRIARTRLSAAALAAGAVLAGVSQRTSAQATQAAASKPPTVDDVFKNVQALKGLTVDDFMLTMGIMSAAVGSDCVGCHPSAGTDHVDWALDTPRKRTARRMVQMVATHQSRQLRRSPGGHLLELPSRPRQAGHDTEPRHRSTASRRLESDDVLTPAQGVPSVDQVLDKYMQALGGAQNVARDNQLRRHGKEHRLSRVWRRRRRGGIGPGARQAGDPHLVS